MVFKNFYGFLLCGVKGWFLSEVEIFNVIEYVFGCFLCVFVDCFILELLN